MIFAAEQGTAYSELVDPMDQRERLVAQSLLAAAGDPEAMQVDEDFLHRAGVRHAADRRHGHAVLRAGRPRCAWPRRVRRPLRRREPS